MDKKQVVAKYCTDEQTAAWCEQYIDACAVQRDMNVAAFKLAPKSGGEMEVDNYEECIGHAEDVAKRWGEPAAKLDAAIVQKWIFPSTLKRVPACHHLGCTQLRHNRFAVLALTAL